MAKIKAILVEPYQRARIVNIEHTLENFQDIVGGLIQVLYPWEDQVASHKERQMPISRSSGLALILKPFHYLCLSAILPVDNLLL